MPVCKCSHATLSEESWTYSCTQTSTGASDDDDLASLGEGRLRGSDSRIHIPICLGGELVEFDEVVRVDSLVSHCNCDERCRKY